MSFCVTLDGITITCMYVAPTNECAESELCYSIRNSFVGCVIHLECDIDKDEVFTPYRSRVTIHNGGAVVDQFRVRDFKTISSLVNPILAYCNSPSNFRESRLDEQVLRDASNTIIDKATKLYKKVLEVIP